MEEILEKLVNKKKITDRDIENLLYDICEDEHASCNSRCPVYDDVEFDKLDGGNCPFFKDGKKMLKHLRD